MWYSAKFFRLLLFGGDGALDASAAFPGFGLQLRRQRGGRETYNAGDGAADLRPQALDGRPYKDSTHSREAQSSQPGEHGESGRVESAPTKTFVLTKREYRSWQFKITGGSCAPRHLYESAKAAALKRPLIKRGDSRKGPGIGRRRMACWASPPPAFHDRKTRIAS